MIDSFYEANPNHGSQQESPDNLYHSYNSGQQQDMTISNTDGSKPEKPAFHFECSYKRNLELQLHTLYNFNMHKHFKIKLGTNLNTKKNEIEFKVQLGKKLSWEEFLDDGESTNVGNTAKMNTSQSTTSINVFKPKHKLKKHLSASNLKKNNFTTSFHDNMVPTVAGRVGGIYTLGQGEGVMGGGMRVGNFFKGASPRVTDGSKSQKSTELLRQCLTTSRRPGGE
jgi:hypothetical protein